MPNLDDLLKWLPSILVIVGWGLINWQTNRREDRKEARALTTAAKDEVVAIADLAIQYQCAPDGRVAHDVKSRLDALEIELEQLAYFGKRSPLMGGLMKFAEASTGGDFDSSTARPHKLDSAEVLSILRARNYMLSELEREFRVHHLGRGSQPR